MAKKRILFIIESFILGGAERVLVDIVNHLDQNKFEITVFSIFKKSVYRNYNTEIDNPFKQHIHYKWLVNNGNQLLYRVFSFLLVRIPSLLYGLLVGDKYDVVVAFYEGAPTAFVANAKITGKKIAWLHTSTDLSQKGKSYGALMRQNHYYSTFSDIIAVSEGVKEDFVHLFPMQKNKVKVIHNPIDTDSIQERSKQKIDAQHPGCPLFVSVGRMTPVKGYDRYLRVINNLVKEGYRFEVWIIGGGDRTDYESFCQENGLDNVKFLGNRSNPYPYMKMADWIVVPSLIEGLSTVVMEGIVLGKAVLATDCPGMKELLGNSEFGLIIDNQEEALFCEIKRLLNNSSLSSYYENRTFSRSKDWIDYSSIDYITHLLT